MEVRLVHGVKYEVLQKVKEEIQPMYNKTKKGIAGLATHCIGTAF